MIWNGSLQNIEQTYKEIKYQRKVKRQGRQIGVLTENGL